MAKEKKVLKIKKIVAPKVTMVEYSMKMTIPTGLYANVQPEIRVKALSPDDALNYIAPHMNKMWKEYFMVNERVSQPAPVAIKAEKKPAIAVVKPIEAVKAPVAAPVEIPPAPSSNASVIKANNVINSCKSLEALEMIRNQVEISVKIEEEEKPALLKKIADKNLELTINTVGKDEK